MRNYFLYSWEVSHEFNLTGGIDEIATAESVMFLLNIVIAFFENSLDIWHNIQIVTGKENIMLHATDLPTTL